MLDDKFFDNLKYDEFEPAKGRFLVSEPFLPDPNFSRTVILLTEHNDEGSFGLVLNKALDIKPEDVIEEFISTPFHLFSGGPVSLNEMYYVHNLGSTIEGSLEVLPGLFWGGNFMQISELVKGNELNEDQIKFFVGYSGWSPGQLKDEIKQKSWIVLPGDAQSVLGPSATGSGSDQEMWENLLKKHGKKFELLSTFPKNPELN